MQNPIEIHCPKFENHGVIFEAVKEYCADEIQCRHIEFGEIITSRYNIQEIPDVNDMPSILNAFFKSSTYLEIRKLFIDKIRSCKKWAELYDELNPASKFSKWMQGRIRITIIQMWIDSQKNMKEKTGEQMT